MNTSMVLLAVFLQWCLFQSSSSYANRLATKWQCLTLRESVLEYERFCDGKFDCADLSDEFLCSTKRLRNENRLQRLIANLFGNTFKVDSAVDFSKRMCVPYVENSWRKESCKICNEAEFVCDPLHLADEQSACVKIAEVCDGNSDCPNAEDERFCGQELQKNNFTALSNFSHQNLDFNSFHMMKHVVRGNMDFLPFLEKIESTLSSTKFSCFNISRLTKLLKHRLGGINDNNWSSASSWISSPLQDNIFPANFITANIARERMLMLIRNSIADRNFNRLLYFVLVDRNNFHRNKKHFENLLFLNTSNHLHALDIGFLQSPLDQYNSPQVSSDQNEEFFSQSLGIDQLCDGTIECQDFSDELFCPGKFYCKNRNPLYVDNVRIMDGVADCSDSSDEWFERRKRHTLSSEYSLIDSWVLQILIWVIGIAALFGNVTVMLCTLYGLGKNYFSSTSLASRSLQAINVFKLSSNDASGRKQFSQTKSPLPRRSRLVRIWNSVLVLNLATADLLMGIYLTCLAVISTLYEGRSHEQSTELQYWNYDRKWRTSTTCNVLGILLVVSSQTSVFTLVSLTSLRLYTVVKPFACYRLKFKYLGIICCSTWIISITLAVAPIYPGFANSFITSAFVPLAQVQPPDLNRSVAEEMVRGIKYLAIGSSTETIDINSVPLSWSEMLHYVQMFAPHYSNWKFYGYYSADSVCMPKLFDDPFDDNFWGYTLAVITINFASVVYISCAYTIICSRSAQKSRKAMKHTGHIRNNSSIPNQLQLRRDKSVFNQPSATEICKESFSSSTNKLYQNSQKNQTAKESTPSRRKKTNGIHRRVALLVLTDCACWLPICITSFISAIGHDIPQTAYAITAVVLLPINSALNPILYSKFMRALWLRVWSALRTKTAFLSVLSIEKTNFEKATK